MSLARCVQELALEIATSTQSLVDQFGMTPFHVHLSGANCISDILKVLLDAYPPAVHGSNDVNRKTAVEYFTQRSLLAEDLRTMLRMALERWLVDPIWSWKGLNVWKSDMTSRQM
jgi:hypothetical protein